MAHMWLALMQMKKLCDKWVRNFSEEMYCNKGCDINLPLLSIKNKKYKNNVH